VRRHTYLESEHTVSGTQLPADGPPANSGLPNRLMTAFEVAEFVGCHEETVRRSYLRGLLVSQRASGSEPHTDAVDSGEHANHHGRRVP
jgi:hypothetical protein